MEIFEPLQVEVITFATADVITASGDGDIPTDPTT